MPVTTPSRAPGGMAFALFQSSPSLVVWMVSLAVLVLLPASAGAQDNGLFNHTTDPSIIATQIRLALPKATRGFVLLHTASAPEQLTIAVECIYDSYRYLRAAHESSRNLQTSAKFADPLIALRDERIGRIRVQLRWCADNGGHLVARNPEISATCLEGLGKAIRDLRIIVATTP